MKFRKMMCCALFVAGCFCSTLVWAEGYRGLCTEAEDVVFACEMAKNHKVVSVCASSGFHGEGGYVQYRFGKPGKIEMQYPQEQMFTPDTFRMSRYTRSMVALVDLRFKVKDVGYSVYDDYNAESGPEEYDSGVRVTLPDGREIDIKCGPEVERNLYTIEEFIPSVEE